MGGLSFFFRKLPSASIVSGRKQIGFVEIFASARWVMLGAFAASFVTSGDYLVLSLVCSPEFLAAYFFGFQISRAASGLISGGILNVLMPTFSRLGKEPERQAAGYLRALRTVSAMASPFCFGSAAIIAPLIHFLWAGKWDESAIVAQWMLVSIPLALLSPIGRSFLEAKEKWRLQSLLLWGNAIGILVASTLGAMLGSLMSIAASVAVWRICNGVIMVFAGSRVGRVSALKALFDVGKFPLISAVALITSLTVFANIEPGRQAVAYEMALSGGMFLIAFSILSFVFLREQYRDLLLMLNLSRLRLR